MFYTEDQILAAQMEGGEFTYDCTWTDNGKEEYYPMRGDTEAEAEWLVRKFFSIPKDVPVSVKLDW
jgi:hypothetical protein